MSTHSVVGHQIGRVCCGSQYIDNKTSLCCVSDTRHSKVGVFIYNTENRTQLSGRVSTHSVVGHQIGRVCCGSQYIDNKTSLCCVSDTRHSKVGVFIYNTENRTSVVECPLIVWWVIRLAVCVVDRSISTTRPLCVVSVIPDIPR